MSGTLAVSLFLIEKVSLLLNEGLEAVNFVFLWLWLVALFRAEDPVDFRCKWNFSYSFFFFLFLLLESGAVLMVFAAVIIEKLHVEVLMVTSAALALLAAESSASGALGKLLGAP